MRMSLICENMQIYANESRLILEEIAFNMRNVQ